MTSPVGHNKLVWNRTPSRLLHYCDSFHHEERTDAPVGDECKGQSYEAKGTAQDDTQCNRSTLSIPIGGSGETVVGWVLWESMDLAGVEGLHIHVEEVNVSSLCIHGLFVFHFKYPGPFYETDSLQFHPH